MSDRELTELLDLAAAAAPAPTASWSLPTDPDVAHDAAHAAATTRLRRWRTPLAAAAAIAVALAVGSQVLDDPAPEPDVVSAPDRPTTPTFPASGDDNASAGSGTASGGGNSLSPGASGGTASTPALPRVVHTGSIAIEVDEGTFAAAVERVTAVTTGLGGFVASSELREQGDAPRGSIVVRVPAAGFEPLLAEVRRLGEVRSVTSRGEDVTAQYTDLEARLAALRATRDQFLTILGDAQAIGDVLAVQDRINAVNLEIESLEGQRRYLEDQSGFGTLTVEVAEPGAEDLATITVGDDGDDGLSGAWLEARRGFGNTIEWIVARSGKGLVLAVVALAVLAVGHRVRRRLRRTVL
jgi:hypothetical protein